MSDIAIGRDNFGVVSGVDLFEVIRYRTVWVAEKWSEEACKFVARRLGLNEKAAVSSALLRKLVGKPEEEVEEIGNVLLNEGITELLNLLCGTGTPTAYSNANAQLGVGDSTTAAAAAQTDLQAVTNKLWKGMNATYPQVAAQTATWQADFTNAEANFAWQEASIRNGATADKNLNRKVQSLGTKASGTWTLTGQITLA